MPQYDITCSRPTWTIKNDSILISTRHDNRVLNFILWNTSHSIELKGSVTIKYSELGSYLSSLKRTCISLHLCFVCFVPILWAWNTQPDVGWETDLMLNKSLCLNVIYRMVSPVVLWRYHFVQASLDLIHPHSVHRIHPNLHMWGYVVHWEVSPAGPYLVDERALQCHSNFLFIKIALI